MCPWKASYYHSLDLKRGYCIVEKPCDVDINSQSPQKQSGSISRLFNKETTENEKASIYVDLFKPTKRKSNNTISDQWKRAKSAALQLIRLPIWGDKKPPDLSYKTKANGETLLDLDKLSLEESRYKRLRNIYGHDGYTDDYERSRHKFINLSESMSTIFSYIYTAVEVVKILD